VKSLSKMLAVEDNRRFAIVRIHIIAHIDFQYFTISIIEIVAAFAISPSVLGFGKINVRNAVDPYLFKIDEMFLAVFVDRHKSDKAYSRNTNINGRVEHFPGFLWRINIPLDEIATQIYFTDVYTLKIYCS